MLNNLSFRAKLILLLACAIVGFVLVTWVAIHGMSAQQNANQQLRTYGDIGSSVDKISLGILEAADQLRNLNESNYSAYQSELTQRKEADIEILQTNINATQRAELKDSLENAKDTLVRYADALLALASQRSTIGFDNDSGLKGKITQLGNEIATSVERLSLLRRDFVNVRKFEATYLSNPSPEVMAELENSFERFNSKVNDFGFKDSLGPIANDYYNSLQAYGPAFTALQQAESGFDSQKLAFANGQLQLANQIEALVQQAEVAADRQSNQSLYTLIAVSIAVAIASILLMMSIGRSARNTLMQVINDLVKVKDGDMTAKASINSKRNDEFDALSKSLNEMTGGLGNVLSEVVSTTSNVSHMINDLNGAISNIADNNRSVTQRTSSLAVATDDISGRITSLSSTTDELREHSNETYQSAKAGAKTIRVVLDNLKGTVDAVNLTGQQLDELGRLSSDIDNVIGMINDLANQTNLLALNAAIEAARAGEAGRGFSVVADEVRSLAEKTVDATSKITDIVGTIQNSTQTAISTMEQGQERLRVIEHNGGEAEEAIRIIENNAQTSSQASDHMAASIQDVASTAIQMSTEMDQIARQLSEDSDSIERIVNSAQQIHGMADTLADKTRVFTLA
ncbi:Methyl-accepting chemotaxis protein 4 [Marinomonas aquimarina]|uniref:Methyl-accepting chemotaxis protein 4 n=1 Tax=Marinomonas aquimarina TaxID=295068 RepID=A0A1A8TS50_9GAMM|nr:methyl-accepting chemotaxis protein [Marinomonas aquimarina]SBS35789.1 Methyl-accepting chemotaxis protein 4 [Marinomonas aquimarina]